MSISEVWITGGAETAHHSTKSAHYQGFAIDLSVWRNSSLDSAKVKKSALKAGFTHGHLEEFKSNSNRDHWHLQISGQNYKKPSQSLLSNSKMHVHSQ